MSGVIGYWTVWLFFSVLFGVFYVLAYSVLMGVRDNYYRYAQKERLQWTGAGEGKRSPRPALWKFLLAAIGTAWLVVHFIIYD